MKKAFSFFFYCFYRLESWQKKHPHFISQSFPVSGVTGAMWFNILTLVTIIGYYYNFKVHILYMVPVGLILLLINSSLFTEKQYKYLESKYKVERKKTLKGYGVGLYLIGSIILYVIVLSLF